MVPFLDWLDLLPIIVLLSIFISYCSHHLVFSIFIIFLTLQCLFLWLYLSGLSRMTPSCSMLPEDWHIYFYEVSVQEFDPWNNSVSTQFIMQALHVVYASLYCICSMPASVTNASGCCLPFHFLWFFGGEEKQMFVILMKSGVHVFFYD